MRQRMEDYFNNTPDDVFASIWDDVKRWNEVGPTVEDYTYDILQSLSSVSDFHCGGFKADYSFPQNDKAA